MIRKLLIVGILIYAFFDSVNSSLPCEFKYTANITSGHKDKDGNIVYKGDVFSSDKYAEFDYVEVFNGERSSVDKHIRGCVCDVKTCVRICCRGESEQSCYVPDVVISKTNNNTKIDLSDDKYAVHIGRPCDSMAVIETDSAIKAVKNGFITYDGYTYTRDRVCLYTYNKSVGFGLLCHTPEYYDETKRLKLHSFGAVTSIPFLIATFFFYALIPELRNLHGKCLMCYIVALLIPFGLEFFSGIQGLSYEIGCLNYFAIFSGFLWLGVMCYDLWSLARKGITHESTEQDIKTFLKYFTFAFGVPILMTILFVAIHHFNLFGIGAIRINEFRWFVRDLTVSDFICVYIPTTLILLVTAFFIVQAGRKLKKDLSNATKYYETRFYVYLCILIPIIMMWFMDTFSWILIQDPIVTYIADILNFTQGLWVFLVCICNRNARNVIGRRLCSACMSKEGSVSYANDLDTKNEMADTKLPVSS